MTLTLRTKIHGPVAIIGDVHGQVDKLAVVLNRLKSFPDYEQRWLVFIGDFVDRGADPKQAIDMFLQTLEEHRRTTAIAGNHEFAMCAALGWFPGGESPFWSEQWIRHYDSDTTFRSYGAEFGDLQELKSKVPDEHRDFLMNLPWCVEHPHLLFVHAGLDPNSMYAMQLRILQERDFTLTRPQWLYEKAFVDADPPRDCPLTVVSGHVKVEEVVFRPKRILVDTTGGYDGDLSCVLMPEGRVITSNPNPQAKPPRPPVPPPPVKAKSWWNLWA